MISLGIDQSLTGTAVCVLDNGRIVFQETIKTDGMTGHGRLAHIVDSVCRTVRAHKPEIIQMEDYSMGMNGATIIKLVELGSVIKWFLHELGYAEGTNLLVVAATSMKKFVLGKGNVQKDTSYLLTIFDKLHERFSDDNAADAYMHAWMASMVIQVLRGKISIGNLTNTQQEALISKGVRKQKGLSITKAMKLPDEEKAKLVSL